MQTAKEKQAIYINELSYRLYELYNSTDTTIIMPYEKALELSYPMACKMIQDLKEKVEKAEYTENFLKMQWYSDKLVEVPLVKFIDNYKDIDSFKVNTTIDQIDIVTINGNDISISTKGMTFINQGIQINLEKITEILKQAIDESKRVNIYSISKYIFILLENQNRDNTFKKTITLYNNMLKSTKGYVIKNTKDQPLYERSLKIVKLRAIENYSELENILTDPQRKKAFIDTINLVNTYSYGILAENVPVKMY